MLEITRIAANGQYLSTTYCDEAALGFEDQKLIYLGHADRFVQYHDFASGKPVDMPPKPSEHHAFDYTLKRWVADTVAAWDSVKQQRSRLLADSDWVVTKATEAGQAVAPAWMVYRQALRDITLQADPWAIVWPVAPSN